MHRLELGWHLAQTLDHSVGKLLGAHAAGCVTLAGDVARMNAIFDGLVQRVLNELRCLGLTNVHEHHDRTV